MYVMYKVLWCIKAEGEGVGCGGILKLKVRV